MEHTRRRWHSIALLLLLPLLIACSATTPQIPASDSSASAQGSAAGAPRAATRLALTPLQAQASLLTLAEFTIETDGIVANRFDPAQFDLWVRFTSPSGTTIRIPAFSFQDYDPASLQPIGAPAWRVRWTPTEAGSWSAEAELTQPALRSAPIGITVDANTQRHGFVRINPQNPRYFAYDDGTFFFPIGLNLGWSTQAGAGVLRDYERWLDRLSQNGGNVARVWMASWSFGLEWNDTGLGDYTRRMKQAWLLDRVFQLAEQRGITIMLCLLNHGAFSTSVNPEWDANPYNAANGGPLANPAEFVTSTQARDLFKRRTRYIAARWGYATNLLAWEWWNEVNWTPIDDGQLRPWIADMSGYIAQLDPYDHLVTNSHANGTSTEIWSMPELDFGQQHDYNGNDLARMLPRTFRELAKAAPDKPVLLSELGVSASGADGQIDGDVIQLHNGLWAAPFSGFAGTGMYWWWDTFVDPHDQWAQFKGIATFLRDENLATLTPRRPKATPITVTALALQRSDHALVWLRSGEYDAAKAIGAANRAQFDRQDMTAWRYQPPTISGATVTLVDLDDGTYIARWLDPHTVEPLDEQRITVTGGTMTLSAPPFARDLAITLIRDTP